MRAVFHRLVRQKEHRIEQSTLTSLPLFEAQGAEYTVVHVGFAISRLSEEEAQETLKLLQELGEFEAELGLQADGTDG